MTTHRLPVLRGWLAEGRALEQVGGGLAPLALEGGEGGAGRVGVDEAAEVEGGGEPLAGLLGVGGLPALPVVLLFAVEPTLLRRPFCLLLGAFPCDPQPPRLVVAGGGEAPAVRGAAAGW
jgi:hypothetical protein